MIWSWNALKYHILFCLLSVLQNRKNQAFNCMVYRVWIQHTVLTRKTKIYSDLLLNDTEKSFFFAWFHDFLRERSSGTSLVIFRFLISSLTVIFITSPRFIPLNLRLDPWFWLLCACWCHLFPALSDFPKDWVQWLEEKLFCLRSCLLLQPEDQVLL